MYLSPAVAPMAARIAHVARRTTDARSPPLGQATVEQVERQCWQLLKSNELPPQGFMLEDCEDVGIFSYMEGDVLRKESLEKLSQRYCFDILLVLFRCLEQRNEYESCIAFMSRVRERQPLVMQALSNENLDVHQKNYFHQPAGTGPPPWIPPPRRLPEAWKFT